MKHIVCLYLLLVCNILQAQLKDTSSVIKLINADNLYGTSGDDKQYNKLIGNVSLQHDGSTLTCDSAYMYLQADVVEAFSNVVIVTNNGAQITSDYLKYTGKNSVAYLKGNVHLTEGANTLNSEDLTYNIKTKVGKYTQGATFQTNATTVVSDIGTYNGKTKETYFKGNVMVTDPKYNIESKEMKYNTDNKLAIFLDESTIVTDNNTIVTKNGTYDGTKEIGNFITRSTVTSVDQEVTANKIYYNKSTGISTAEGQAILEDFKNERIIRAKKLTANEKTGINTATGNASVDDTKNNQYLKANDAIYNNKLKQMKANGNVSMYDFKDNRTLFCEHFFYNELNGYSLAELDVWLYDSMENTILNCGKLETNQKHKITLAKIKPLIRTLSDKDSLFIRADSFFMAPSIYIDTLAKLVPNFIKDSALAESKDSIRTLLGLGKVKVFSDSMQAICDSLSYSQKDSMFRFFKHPILWSTDNQAIGDTIYVTSKNNKIKQLLLMQNATVISIIKEDSLFNQVGGNFITVNIDSSQVKDMFVDGSAESIYYNQNDKGQYEGVNVSKSQQLKMLMKDKKVDKIIFYKDPEGKFLPLEKASPNELKIAGFKWLIDLKPKNKQALINQGL